MNIAEMIINMVVKKGLIYEAKDANIEFDIPREGQEPLRVIFKAEHMTLRVKNEEES